MPRDRSLTSAESRLVARFAAIIPLEVIHSTLARVHADLVERSTVTSYLAILADRHAARELTELARRPQPPGGRHTDGRPQPNA